MPSDIDNLKAALERVRESQAAAEQAFEEFAAKDFPRENAILKEKAEAINAQLQEALRKNEALSQEYEALRRTFVLEMASKRSVLTSMSETRAQEYYHTGLEREHARINELNSYAQRNIAYIADQLRYLDETERAPLNAELGNLSLRVNAQAQAARQRAEAAWAQAAAGHSNTLKSMNDEPLGSEALTAVRKFFDWEAFLGLKIISAVGMLLILIGVFTFGRYLYIRMTGAFQCAAIFALGAVLLASGEVLYRKWRGAFATALTAGGTGVLFLGAALGYMTLGVLPMLPALLICAGVSVLTFLLALRYNAQLVAVFALVGGYLPLIALEPDIALYAALYFIIFDMFVLAVATRKMWRVTRFFGLFAGLIAQMTLLNLSIGNDAYIALGAAIGIGSVAYLIIPVFGAALTKNMVKPADIVMLAISVGARFLIAMAWWSQWQGTPGEQFEWLIPAFFFAACLVMAFLCERGRTAIIPTDDKGSLRALFFITAVSFAALVVLYALDDAWLSTGWLVEATGLLTYGLWKSRRRFTVAGIVIGVICVITFLTYSVSNYDDPHFVIQYGLLTTALVLVALVTLRAKLRGFAEVFRCAAAMNVWWFIIYVLLNPLLGWLEPRMDAAFAMHIMLLASIVFGLLYGLLLPRVRKIGCSGFRAAAIATSACATVWLISYNSNSRMLHSFDDIAGVCAFILYIAVNIVCIVWTNDLLRFACSARKLQPAWYPLLLSGWVLFLVTQNMVVQMSLSVSSLVLTLLFGIWALAWVLFGFWKRNAQTRISGLALTFVCVAKLFLLDLYDLTSEWRIVSYFIGGIILLAISFTYQYFNKKLKAEEEDCQRDFPEQK